MNLTPQEKLVACRAVLEDMLRRFECDLQYDGSAVIITHRLPLEPRAAEDDVVPVTEEPTDGK